MNDKSPDPVETALLARLLVRSRRAPSESEVMRSLRPLFGQADASRANDALRSALAGLERDGFCESSTMTLTPAGKKRACAVLGLTPRAIPTQWRVLKGILVELALGRTAGPRRRALTAGAVRAAALASKLGIETTTTSTSDVLDAWAAREMGMDGKRLTIANVRAHFLSRALGIGALRDPKRISAVATAHVLGIPRDDAATIRDSVLRGWLGGVKGLPSKTTVKELDLPFFANAVKEVARSTTEGRFGRHKVFIAPIWAHARGLSALAHLDEHEFKAKLVDAHRAGLLRLSRADLTPAMAQDVVRASEVAYLNAVFHFVDLEGTLS